MGLALIESEHANIGETFDVIIRDKPIQAVIAKGIFYTVTRQKLHVSNVGLAEDNQH
ncbi:MAG: hypothetical protein ACRC2T_09780 [Thermoguttaceae bacterium]